MMCAQLSCLKTKKICLFMFVFLHYHQTWPFFFLLVYIRQTNHLPFLYSLFGTNSAIKFNLVLQLIWTNQTSKLNFAFESRRVHWKSIISNKSFSHVTLAHVSPKMNNLSNILQSDPFFSFFFFLFNLYHNFLLNPIYWKNYVHHSNNLPIFAFPISIYILHLDKWWNSTYDHNQIKELHSPTPQGIK